jgi:hypothetical protein
MGGRNRSAEGGHEPVREENHGSKWEKVRKEIREDVIYGENPKFKKAAKGKWPYSIEDSELGGPS